MLERLKLLEAEYEAILGRLGDPEVLRDHKAYAEVSRRFKELEPVVLAYRELRGHTDDLEAAKGMLGDSAGADRDFVRSQIEESEAKVAELEEELRVLLQPRDPNDGKNVIVEIRGAEGGEEANLFAKDLFDMYTHYAERHGWKLEVLGADPSDRGGFNEVTFLVKGDDVWSHMKHEGGPHRVQRVPVTESQGRIHTVVGHGDGAAGGGGGRRPHRAQRAQDRRLPLHRPRRAVGEHHRLGGADHPPAHRHRGGHAGREEPDPEPGQGPDRAAGPAAEGGAGQGGGGDVRHPPGPGGRRRPVGEDPDLQLQGQPGHRPPDTGDLKDHNLGKVLVGDLDDLVDGLLADERARQLETGS